MSEIVQTVLSNFIDWLFKPLDNAASSMITGAFTGTAGTVSNSQWNIAITAANRIGWIMGFVNMAICIIGSLHAAVKGSVAESVKSFAMCVLAWPLTAVSVSVMITLEGIVGTVSAKILNVQLSGDTASGEFSDSVVSNLVGTATKYGAQADMLIRLVVYVLVWIASLALSGMLAARLLSLVLLAAVAPLPIMMSGWRTTRPAALKWVEAVAGVMLAKPLSALILMVGSALLNVANNDTNFSSSFFPTLIGLATLFMCCFSPRLVMPAVSFIGANVTGEMQERGGKVGPGAVKTAAQVTAGIVASATAGLSGVGGTTSGLADMVGGMLRGDASGAGEAIGDMLGGKDDKSDGKGKHSDSDSSPTVDAAGRNQSDASDTSGRTGTEDGLPATMPSQAPSPDSVPGIDDADRSDMDGVDVRTSDMPQPEPVSGVPAADGGRDGSGSTSPSQAMPGAPGGRGGDATASGGTGGRGADGGQGGDSSSSSQSRSQGGRGGDATAHGGTGGRGGDGGVGFPTPSHGGPSGPTVG